MCFQEKQLSEFHESSNSRGKQYTCKSCTKSYFDNWRKTRIEASQTEFPQSKTCKECHVEKPISQFGKRSSNKDKKNDYCIQCWRIKTQKALKKYYANKKAAVQ